MKNFPLSRISFALGALGCALTLASCSSNTSTSTSTDNLVDANSITDNAVDTNATDANTTDTNATDANAAPTVNFSSLETIYVPGKDDLLHETKVSRMAMDSQLKSGDPAAPGLQEIIEKSPLYFPKGAKINSTTQTDKGMNVDLNKTFADDEFWRGKGEKTTELAVYALVNSAAKTTSAQGASEPQSVTFTIEKKPAETLGEFAVDGAIEPQMRLVAPK